MGISQVALVRTIGHKPLMDIDLALLSVNLRALRQLSQNLDQQQRWRNVMKKKRYQDQEEDARVRLY